MPLLEVRTPCGWDTSPRAQRATEVLPTAPRSGFLAAKTEGLTWGHKALSTPVRGTEMTHHPQTFQVSPVSPTPAPLNPLGWGGVGDGVLENPSLYIHWDRKWGQIDIRSPQGLVFYFGL